MWPQPRNAGGHQKPEEAGRLLPQSLRREPGPVSTLISDFRPPKLWEDAFLLFDSAKFVIVFYGSPRKLTYGPLSLPLALLDGNTGKKRLFGWLR